MLKNIFIALLGFAALPSAQAQTGVGQAGYTKVFHCVANDGSELVVDTYWFNAGIDNIDYERRNQFVLKGSMAADALAKGIKPSVSSSQGELIIQAMKLRDGGENLDRGYGIYDLGLEFQFANYTWTISIDENTKLLTISQRHARQIYADEFVDWSYPLASCTKPN